MDQGINETFANMKDGDKVLKMLNEQKPKRVSQTRLATEMRMTPTSVGRYIERLNDGSLTDEQWRDMAVAMQSLGMDPARIRPIPPASTKKLPDDLVPLLNRFTGREQLEALIKIATYRDEGARELLALIATERLNKPK